MFPIIKVAKVKVPKENIEKMAATKKKKRPRKKTGGSAVMPVNVAPELLGPGTSPQRHDVLRRNKSSSLTMPLPFPFLPPASRE